MRFVVLLAALAVTLTAVPAAAQKKPEPAQPFREDQVKAGPETNPPVVVPADPANTWVLDLSTGGRVTIRLRPDVAPLMVERIKTLTRSHFYDGIIFHRVNDAPEGMAQAGDPNGNGSGGSTLPNVPGEFNALLHMRGAVSAARTEDKNSANSQFFIMFGPKLTFDHNYTVFGRVTGGMQWVDKIERGEPPLNPSRILHAYIESDGVPPYSADASPIKPELPPGETEVVLPGTAPPKP